MKRSFTLAMAVSVAAMAVTGMAYADSNAGKALFEGAGKCANCHNVNDKKKVGPGLAGVTKRASEDWLKKWLKDPPAVWNSEDEYTKKLKTVMKKEGKPKPAHQTKPLSDQEVADLMEYMKTL